MNKIPSMPTVDEIVKFIGVTRPYKEPVHTRYAAIAYLGMCRHPYMSADWLIAEYAWKECFGNIADCEGDNIADIIKARIKNHYGKENLFC